MRIVREAVYNAVRHRKPRTITVTLRQGAGTRLCVVDGGRGFDLEAERRPVSFGLASMRERAQALGGRIDIRSDPGAGTTIEVSLRLPALIQARASRWR